MLLVSRTLRFWAFALVILLGCGFLKGFVPPELGSLVWGTTSSVVLLALTHLLLRSEGRSWADVGLAFQARSAARFGIGLLIGLATYTLALVFIALVVGPIRLSPGANGALTALPLIFAGLIALGAMEELAFRAYPFWNAIEALGPWAGQILVAVAFALMHIAYGWPWQTVALGVLPSGWLYGIAAFTSRGLALPLGIHIGQNLGRALTGEADGVGVWSLDTSGADPAALATWAPLLGALAPLAVSLIIWAWSRHRPVR